MSGPGERLVILLNKAVAYEQQGEPEQALAVLWQAAECGDDPRRPRLRSVLTFNLATNLCHLGRFAEAEPLLGEARELAVQQGQALDLVRILWLDAKVLAGQGRPEDAISALEQVCRDLTARDMAYDFALAALNLAELYLRAGRGGEVRALAQRIEPLFRERKVHREAAMALGAFCRAARQEVLTLDLVQRVAAYLQRARHDPGLSFQP